ncbi:hypothetical protein M0R45_036543 [Rubus argutus]|uniref:KIB1-4 beta-propeller domain-containing protein n=1 Tax=Rubus argutus TaxID=59490 RepID=A0AAW1VZ51_RUBAR
MPSNCGREFLCDLTELANPFGRVKAREHQENLIIRLPPLKPPAKDRGLEAWIKRCNYFVQRTMISEDPILNADNCIVVVIYVECIQLAFIKPGKDTTWTYVDERWRGNEEVVHVKDNFYSVNNRSQLLYFKITRDSSSDVTLAAKEIPRKSVHKGYIVDSNEGLLMVKRFLDWEVDKFSN